MVNRVDCRLRYLSAISLALIVLMALACRASPADAPSAVEQPYDFDAVRTRVAVTRTARASFTPTPTPTPTPVPTTYMEGFACTGSMAPAIDCRDRAIWETNFGVDDIKVGTIVAYKPTSDCGTFGMGRNVFLGTSSLIAHRVIEIREVEASPRYLLKGDANPEDDGCLITLSSIDAYIIEIKKGWAYENRGEYFEAMLKRQELKEKIAFFEDKYKDTFWQENRTARQLYCEIFWAQNPPLTACPIGGPGNVD